MAETSIQRGSEDRAAHHAPIVRRPEDHPGHAGRFANVTRMVFHPTPKHPNEPNAGIVPEHMPLANPKIANYQ